MALPLIGAALAGLGRIAVGAGRVAGTAATSTTARVGYGAALVDLAKDAVVGAGKGLVGGLKGAMISEAPGIAGAYAFGKDLRKRANAPRTLSSGSAPPPVNKSKSSSPVIGGLGSLNTTSIVVGQKQSNIINLEQVRQLKQLNDSVINQSKLISYQIDDTKRKNQFTEEAANEQAIRDDKLLEAIRNIGGGGGGGKRGGGDAANDSSGGGFLSSMLGGAAGGAISKLIPLLTGAMAALPWARILRLATPVGAATVLTGSTPDKETQKKQDDFYRNRDLKQAQERAAEEAKDIPRPLDRSNGNYRNNQRVWDEKYQGRKDPISGKTLSGIYNIPISGTVSSTTGSRNSKTPGMSTNHQGVDIAAILGSRVNSIAYGTVIDVDKEGGAPDAKGFKKGLGRFVTIDHGQGVISKYAHLSEVSVSKGDKVGPGVELGKSGGNTEDPGSGASTGPHLHLETTNHGKFIDPSMLQGLARLGQVNNNVQAGAAAGLPPSAATPGPAAGNSPAKSSDLKVIKSSAKINAGPIEDFTKENNAKIGAIQNSSKIKNDILKIVRAGEDPISLTSLKAEKKLRDDTA
jgi:murein DD-endopeptidase MepM/ murein hydrolase activator NlpD